MDFAGTFHTLQVHNKFEIMKAQQPTTMRTAEVKSNKDLMALIAEWEDNPNWELEDTPGFEEHYQVLKDYRKQRQETVKKSKQRKKKRAAQSMNLTLPIYEIWKENKDLFNMHREKSRKMMANLIYDTTKISEEQQATIEALLDSIFRGCINAAKAEIISEKYRTDR